MDKTIQRVFIIGLDGAGNFIKDTQTPNLDRLIATGAVTNNAKAVFPSISAECWGSILHGVLPEKHGLTNEIVESEMYQENSPFPSIFKLARETFPNAKLASFCGWSPINYGIIEESSQCHKVSIPDQELCYEAADYIKQNPDLKLFFIQLDSPDASGHRHGYGTKPYLESITVADGYVGVLINAIEEANLLHDSLIIFTADHGGGGDAGAYAHGSNHPMDMTVFWGCHGPGINNETNIGDLCIMDTAAVVAHALGLSIPKDWDAKIPTGLELLTRINVLDTTKQ